MKEISTIIDHYQRWQQQEKRMALATVINTEASSYRRVGARMLVAEDGSWIGGISGGCLEGDALRRTQRVINSGRADTHTYDTRDGEDKVIGIGLGCEGRIDILFSPIDASSERNTVAQLQEVVNTRQPTPFYTLVETPNARLKGRSFLSLEQLLEADTSISPIKDKLAAAQKTAINSLGSTSILVEILTPAIQLIVVGDNYDVLALGKQCQLLGWPMKLVGTSRKFTQDHRKCADELIDIKQLEQLSIDNYTAVALMSHDYPKDLKGLRHFLPLQPHYLGLLGPVKRKRKLLTELGLNAPSACLYGPIGLNIGAQTPEEIALSIVGDILRVFRQRPGGSLRSLKGSIYGNP